MHRYLQSERFAAGWQLSSIRDESTQREELYACFVEQEHLTDSSQETLLFPVAHFCLILVSGNTTICNPVLQHEFRNETFGEKWTVYDTRIEQLNLSLINTSILL